MFLAFESDGLKVAVKAYFIPDKSVQTEGPRLGTVIQALESLKIPAVALPRIKPCIVSCYSPLCSVLLKSSGYLSTVFILASLASSIMFDHRIHLSAT